MTTDKEIALRVQLLQTSGKDIPLVRLPGYMEWSEKKLDEGVSAALIANLDARSMFLLQEDVQAIGVDVYEELLQDLKDEIGE